MNMQQIMMQAQKIQRDLKKAKAELAEKDFIVAKNGMVEISMKGNKSINYIHVDEDALDPENKEMLEETIAMAINEAITQIEEADKEINERITGSSAGNGLF